MVYNPAEPTSLDTIRGMVQDTAEPPFFADDTYTAIMGYYVVPADPTTARATAGFWYAAAELALRLATYLENRPSSINSPGDGSISWSSRTTTLRSLAADWKARGQSLDVTVVDEDSLIGPVVTISSSFLTGYRGDPWRS